MKQRFLHYTKRMERRRKHFIAYIPLTRSTNLQLFHDLYVAGEIYVGEDAHADIITTSLDLIVPGDLFVAGEIYVKTNLVPGPNDRVVHGNLIVGGLLTVGS